MATIAASVLVFLLVAPIAVYGATFPVDWTLGTDYSSWASKSVSVGDQIVFTYSSNHDVLVVSKSGYTNCDSSSPIFSDNSGSTAYNLTTEGAVYFICGISGHCSGGMQLQLNVKASSSSSPPSTPATPPSSSTPSPPSSDSPTTPSSDSTPPPPPPPPSSKNGAASGGFSWLVFGVSCVFGALLMS